MQGRIENLYDLASDLDGIRNVHRVLEDLGNPSGEGRLTVAGWAEGQQAPSGAHCGQESLLSVEGCETVLDLASRIKLPRLVVQQLLDEAVQQKLIHAMNASSSLGLSIRYALSEMGRNAAKEALDQNLYVGPTPVSLSAYADQIAIQRMVNELLDADTLRRGFEGLVVPENYLRKRIVANIGVGWPVRTLVLDKEAVSHGQRQKTGF